jgi:hypothetical protein
LEKDCHAMPITGLKRPNSGKDEEQDEEEEEVDILKAYFHFLSYNLKSIHQLLYLT